jgi:cytoskeletal protein CcmA (bactofilin family)
MNDASTRTTVVEEGTSLTGTLTASGPVQVLGRVDGDITGPTVEVAASGVITGTVKATMLRSRGELSGHFEADDIELAGRVLDETVIRAKALQVTFGGDSGMVFGACELEIGEAPDKTRALREANAVRRPRQTEAPAPAPDPVKTAALAAEA